MSLAGFGRPNDHCFYGREVPMDSGMYYTAGTLAEVNPHWNLPSEGPYSSDGFVRLPAYSSHNCWLFSFL